MSVVDNVEIAIDAAQDPSAMMLPLLNENLALQAELSYVRLVATGQAAGAATILGMEIQAAALVEAETMDLGPAYDSAIDSARQTELTKITDLKVQQAVVVAIESERAKIDAQAQSDAEPLISLAISQFTTNEAAAYRLERISYYANEGAALAVAAAKSKIDAEAAAAAQFQAEAQIRKEQLDAERISQIIQESSRTGIIGYDKLVVGDLLEIVTGVPFYTGRHLHHRGIELEVVDTSKGLFTVAYDELFKPGLQTEGALTPLSTVNVLGQEPYNNHEVRQLYLNRPIAIIQSRSLRYQTQGNVVVGASINGNTIFDWTKHPYSN